MVAVRGIEGSKLIRWDCCILKNLFIELYEGGSWHINVALCGLFYHTPKLLRALFEHVWKFEL